MGGRERWSVVRGLLSVVRKLRWGTSKVEKSEGLKVEDGGGFAQTIRNVILLPAG
jgi:hypothetical protein